MTKSGKRRSWSAGEKRMICAQTRVPGVSVSQVARRYDVNANLVFRWLRDPRFNRLTEDHAAVSFLPVEGGSTNQARKGTLTSSFCVRLASALLSESQ